MNKLYFIKLFIKSKIYQMLCKLNIHPLNYYVRSYPLYNNRFNRLNQNCKVADVYKCKLCGKKKAIERN